MIALNPGVSMAWSSRGYCLIKLGRIQDAIKSFDKALELYPGNSDAVYGRVEAIRVMWPSYTPAWDR